MSTHHHQVPDTPWHADFLRMSEDDTRRDCRKCKFYDGKTKLCKCTKSPYYNFTCGGSSHCQFYKHISYDEELNYFLFLVLHINDYSIYNYRIKFNKQFKIPNELGTSPVYLDIPLRKFVRSFYYDKITTKRKEVIHSLLNKINTDYIHRVSKNDLFDFQQLTKEAMGYKIFIHSFLLFISYLKYYYDLSDENKAAFIEGISYFFNHFSVETPKMKIINKFFKSFHELQEIPYKELIKYSQLDSYLQAKVYKQMFQHFCQVFYCALGKYYMNHYFNRHQEDHSNEYYIKERELKLMQDKKNNPQTL